MRLLQHGVKTLAPAREAAVQKILEDLRALPPDELRTASFALRHGELAAFDHPGGMLEGFEKEVMERWYAWLWGMGFEWDRCYSILRTSGAGTVTGYHMVSL